MGALRDMYKEFCLNLTFKYFPDYERAGVIHCLKVVRLITDLICISLLIACCVGDTWLYQGDTASIGLWRHCWTVTTSDGDVIDEICRELTGDEMTFAEKSCRIFAVMSCLCMLSALLLSLFGIFSSRSHGAFHSISILSSVTCTVAALVLFSLSSPLNYYGDNTSYGWAYIVGWTCVAFTMVCWSLVYCTMSVFND